MKSLTLAHPAVFQRYSKKARRDSFLEENSTVLLWAELLAPLFL